MTVSKLYWRPLNLLFMMKVLHDDPFEIHRWPLLFPVFIALGIHGYVSLDQEPSLLWTILGSLTVLIFIIFILKIINTAALKVLPSWKVALITWGRLCFLLLSCFILGFSAMKIRTEWIAPVVFPYSGTATFTGTIDSIEDVPRGTLKRPRLVRRFVLKVTKESFKKNPQIYTVLQAHHFPNDSFKIRVQGPFSKLNKIQSGQDITLTAEIFPPLFPLNAHGYDAPFDAYFKGLSAFGKLKEVVDIAPQKKLSEIKRLRLFLKNKFFSHLSGQAAPLASALIIGDKSGMTLQTRENFTKAGLSHLLAISGLHMGLISLMIFFLITKFLALIPPLAIRYPVKKIAAIFTIPASLFYLLLSGCSFSALRAFIMFVMVMIAILQDRKVLNLLNVSFAACIILILFPESLYSISFQLSFASVTGLCCIYENRLPFLPSKSWWRLLNPIFHTFITTSIATLVTAPCVIYTFQRFTWVGLIGNILAIPLLSFFIMPFAILAAFSWGNGTTVVMPILQSGFQALLTLAEKIASLPYSSCILAKPSQFSFLLIILSSLWIIIWKGSKRWLALPSLLGGVYLFFMPKSPTYFLTQDIIGLNDGKTFWISDLRKGSFHAKIWSSECGLTTINKMPYSKVLALKAAWHNKQFALKPNEILLSDGYKTTKIQFNTKRPWYKNSIS